MDTFYHNASKTTTKVTALNCRTICDEEHDVVITDAHWIGEYCISQMGDVYDYGGFLERLYEAGYQLEDVVAEVA